MKPTRATFLLTAEPSRRKISSRARKAIPGARLIRKRRKSMLIKECMTKSPYTVGVDTPLLKARELLSEHDIHHLPVLDGEKLVGMMSDRNLKEALASPGGEKFLVEDAMMPDVFAVSPDTELATVVEAMAAEKYSYAVIRGKDEKVAGVFTTVDACRMLAELLKVNKAC
jgi:CBS domain-containing protein